MAKGATGAQLERLCGKLRTLHRPGKPYVERRFVARRHMPDGTVRIELRLHPDEAERVWEALQAIRQELVAGAFDDIAAVAGAPSSMKTQHRTTTRWVSPRRPLPLIYGLRCPTLSRLHRGGLRRGPPYRALGSARADLAGQYPPALSRSPRDLDGPRTANLADQFTYALTDHPAQHRLAAIWAEHEVVGQPVDRVRSLAVALHAPKAPQAS
jgi:hypothetical protein